MEYSFYNANRSACRETTLHNRNLSDCVYKRVIEEREILKSFRCTETMPGQRDRQFNSINSNKENKQQMSKQRR
ncbi:hypothetical protein [Chrysodeixis includens nucleopolyhedrovirus]|uniref:Uncharacterized protein n=1 Tax=Chrysodeixis includens nucleopolyhedrovirus TaxID=1207438 RepID=A0A5B8YRE6_9ABAC|nr:hypothetical protein QKU06_gp062 [Chrysodeixis includens nucleopolyhedrovirus]QED40590.1 hypothetical protein [Chrysodeixis includens nucleopolyhedrovirus]